jgi:glycosyltransferase involved in cell wall biosynthesis
LRTVSVVIPMYNAVRFVRDAIDSVLAQGDGSLTIQVIVADNRSQDGSATLVRERYGDRVLLTEEPLLQGCGPARNVGVRLATGEFLAFLDADDVWLPGKLERQIAALEARPDAGRNDLVFTHAVEFHCSELSEEEKRSAPCRPSAYPMLTASSLLCRRDTFLEVGDFPPYRLGEFIAWYGWAETLGKHKLMLPEVLVRRRVHGTNTTRGAQAVAEYTLATKWLLDRRRQHTNSVL